MRPNLVALQAIIPTTVYNIRIALSHAFLVILTLFLEISRASASKTRGSLFFMICIDRFLRSCEGSILNKFLTIVKYIIQRTQILNQRLMTKVSRAKRPPQRPKMWMKKTWCSYKWTVVSKSWSLWKIILDLTSGLDIGSEKGSISYFLFTAIHSSF